MYAQRRQAQTADTAYVHCTETDKCIETLVVGRTVKELIIFSPLSDCRVILRRRDARRPYVGRLGGLELTCLDADIE